MKISIHAKMRMRERTPFNHNERRTLFRSALQKGKSIQDIKNNEVREYLKTKQNDCKVKLFKDYIFIYSKHNKLLYTMYKLPDELLGKEKS